MIENNNIERMKKLIEEKKNGNANKQNFAGDSHKGKIQGKRKAFKTHKQGGLFDK